MFAPNVVYLLMSFQKLEDLTELSRANNQKLIQIFYSKNSIFKFQEKIHLEDILCVSKFINNLLDISL